MIDRETRMRLLNLDQLPTLPEVMIRILQAVDDEATSASELSLILEQDHAITARLLRLANSAFYGFPSHIESVQRAVVLIGYHEVKMLALATSVFDTFRQLRQYAIDPHDFWMHSLGTAKGAAHLATELRLNCPPQTCFTAGLLHDMGKYALAAVLGKTYKHIITEAKERQTLVKEAELRILNTTHAEVGSWLAEQWNFPETLRKPIGDLYGCRTNASCSRETAAVAAADVLSRYAYFGTAGDLVEDPCSLEFFNVLGLSNEIIARNLEQLRLYKDKAEELLNVLSGE